MNGSVDPAAIAISISMGTSLLAGFVSMWVAIGSRRNSAVNRDTVVSILFGIAFLLMLLNVIAAAVLAAGGMAYVGLVKATLLLTAAFAAAGMVFGLMRSLRSGRAVKTQSV
jgi:hypothetical protein